MFIPLVSGSGCWCLGDARSQGISSYGIDMFSIYIDGNIPVSVVRKGLSLHFGGEFNVCASSFLRRPTGSHGTHYRQHIDGVVQNCSISIANAMGILQSCTKPPMLWINITVKWLFRQTIETKGCRPPNHFSNIKFNGWVWCCVCSLTWCACYHAHDGDGTMFANGLMPIRHQTFRNYHDAQTKAREEKPPITAVALTAASWASMFTD